MENNVVGNGGIADGDMWREGEGWSVCGEDVEGVDGFFDCEEEEEEAEEEEEDDG